MLVLARRTVRIRGSSASVVSNSPLQWMLQLGMRGSTESDDGHKKESGARERFAKSVWSASSRRVSLVMVQRKKEKASGV